MKFADRSDRGPAGASCNAVLVILDQKSHTVQSCDALETHTAGSSSFEECYCVNAVTTGFEPHEV